MRKLFYFILLISLVCCNKKNPKAIETILYYPSKEFFNSNDLVEIDLNNPKLKFKKITHRVNDIHTKDSTPYILLKQNATIKKIMPLRNDWGLIIKRNSLRISKDSIFIDDNYSIRDLYWVLKRHYEDNGKTIHYAQSTERAWIEIEIDTNDTGLELKKVLDKLTNTFDKINKHHADSLKLKIGFSYFHQIPPPPPPPKEND